MIIKEGYKEEASVSLLTFPFRTVTLRTNYYAMYANSSGDWSDALLLSV
jgi:hypothetical protein